MSGSPWGREGDGFELAIEAVIPEGFRSLLENKNFNTVRYEVSFSIDIDSEEFVISTEKVVLKGGENFSKTSEKNSIEIFPNGKRNPPKTIISQKGITGRSTIVSKSDTGDDKFYAEVPQPAMGEI